MSSNPEPISEPLFPKNVSSYLTLFIGLEIGALIISFPVALTAAWPSLWESVLYTLIGGLALSPLCLIFAATQTDYLHQKLGNVNFDGEAISVFDKAHHCEYTAKLCDCRWFIGSRSWATVPVRKNLIGTGNGEAILIVFPDSIRTPEYRVHKTEYAEGPAIVAVGLTPEKRLRWEQVIWQSNVERDVRRESLTPPLSNEFSVLWTVFVLPTSWFFCLWVSRTIDSLLKQLNIPADIAQGISFPIFVPGVVWVIAFLLLFPMSWRKELDVHQHKRERYIQFKSVLSICIVTGMIIAACWSIVGNDIWTTRSAIAATVFNVVLAIGICIALWFLLAESNKENKSLM